jgi:hypothetical protein
MVGHEQSDSPGKSVGSFFLTARILGVGQKGIASKGQNRWPNQD